MSATIAPAFPIAHTAAPTHSSAPSPSAGSCAISAYGSEKRTTNAAWSWKNQKNLRFARSPHFARSAR